MHNKQKFNPNNYSEDEIKEKIISIKKRYGSQLLILGHHYQRMEIIELSDLIGDSYGLSKEGSLRKDAKFIIFCGVRFMAESAKILAQPNQKVFLPNIEAGCPLSDMADITDVKRAWADISQIVSRSSIVPITYMNSSSELKSFCGQNRGTVCTSRNAESAFKWALSTFDKLFFFPDKNLGQNTANKLNIPLDKIITWNPDEPLGGNSVKAIKDSRVILWYGFCHVHTKFTASDIENVRTSDINAKIIVHPECTADVVKLADANGSTNFIADFVKKAGDDSTIYIGTEINLVQRLSKENPNKNIYELSRSICPNMYRINLSNLLYTLENLDKIPDVNIEQTVACGAKIALNKMLEL